MGEAAVPFYNEITDSTNFVISFTANPKNDFAVFAKGYTLAANRMANLLLEAPRFSDYEAYPVVLLYRHALELSLKHIIYSSAKLAAFKFLDEVDHVLQNTHDLMRLIRLVEPLLTRLFPDDESLRSITGVVASTCCEISSLDPHSDGYRYPIDSKGRPSTRKHQVVNLRAFASRMSSVLEDLGTIHFGLDIETGRAQEVYEDVRSVLFSVAGQQGT